MDVLCCILCLAQTVPKGCNRRLPHNCGANDGRESCFIVSARQHSQFALVATRMLHHSLCLRLPVRPVLANAIGADALL